MINIKESAGKYVVVRDCIEKRRGICGQESDGDGSARERKERKTE